MQLGQISRTLRIHRPMRRKCTRGRGRSRKLFSSIGRFVISHDQSHSRTAGCHHLDYDFHVTELRSVETTAVSNDNSVVLEADATSVHRNPGMSDVLPRLFCIHLIQVNPVSLRLGKVMTVEKQPLNFSLKEKRMPNWLRQWSASK
ncbi:hypothetical protein Pan54_16740 [Rubinisphaera italica]|uniref:Uncharacterized protein n=1 Tax=Rubinisphaera italica TaxID=2527969 RepID=A0A5C5XGG2_9PLAN|nr:hypothetical protein Pan54_16740 [Rubinisphaera italica]